MRYKSRVLLSAAFLLFLAACDDQPRQTAPPLPDATAKLNSESPKEPLGKEENVSLLEFHLTEKVLPIYNLVLQVLMVFLQFVR